jgi:hypothetical protein
MIKILQDYDKSNPLSTIDPLSTFELRPVAADIDPAKN